MVYQQRQEEAQGMDAQLMRDYGSSEELDQSYMEGEEEEDEMEDVEVSGLWIVIVEFYNFFPQKIQRMGFSKLSENSLLYQIHRMNEFAEN